MQRRDFMEGLAGLIALQAIPTVLTGAEKSYRFLGFKEEHIPLLYPTESAYESFSRFISSEKGLFIPGSELSDYPLGMDVIWNFYKNTMSGPFNFERIRNDQLFLSYYNQSELLDYDYRKCIDCTFTAIHPLGEYEDEPSSALKSVEMRILNVGYVYWDVPNDQILVNKIIVPGSEYLFKIDMSGVYTRIHNICFVKEEGNEETDKG